MSENRDVDPVTGIETTGHVWDGDIKELNKPLPKWWLYTFYATVLWSIGYWIAYPAWPLVNDYTKGMLGYSQRAVVADEVKKAKEAQSGFRDKLLNTALGEVKNDPDLLRFAIEGGRAAFGRKCAPCHGRGAQGFVGYPNLNDDAWIWGNSLEDIEHTILYGIRSDHEETRVSDMPKFGEDELLEPDQIKDVAEFVLSLSGKNKDAEAVGRGAPIYAEQCAVCHGEGGKGNRELGAPNLTDAIWLYGAEKGEVVKSIHTGRGGKMPAWVDRLDSATIKSLALYVQSLGGADQGS